MQGAYFGGYPFQNGGILTAEDLNAIVALALQEPSALDPNAVIEAIPTGGITNDKIATPYVLIGSTSIPLGSAGVHTLAGLNDPVAAQDVANKRYVDNVAGALGYTAGIGLVLTGNQFRLANTAVSPNTYGSPTTVSRITIDPQGRITAADSVPIAISVSAITDGTTGSGPVVLANNPALSNVSVNYLVASGNISTPTLYAGYGQASGLVNIDGSNQAVLQFSASGVGRFLIYRPSLSNDLKIWSAVTGDCMTFQYTTGRVGVGASASVPTVPLAVGVNGSGLSGNTGQLQLLTNGAVRFFAQDAGCFTQGGVGLGAGVLPSGIQFAVGVNNSGLNGYAGQLALITNGGSRLVVYDNAVIANVALGVGGVVPSGSLQLAFGAGTTGLLGGVGTLNLYTGGNSRMTISDDACYTTTSFGVGGAVPNGPQLAIGVGTSGFTGGASLLYIYTNAIARMAFHDSEVVCNVPLGVLISAAGSGYSLIVNGEAAKSVGGSWAGISDGRLKENIRYEFDALDKIRQLKPALFDWREGETGSGGFIAQDVEAVFPEFVSRPGVKGDLVLTLPFKFDAFLVRSIQQLEARLAKIEGTA